MILEKGRFLYRGSHTEAMNAISRIGQPPNFLRTNAPVYFSNTKNSVRSYGTAVKYVTTRDLNLLDMGNINEVARLLERAKSPTVKKSIEKAFRISNGEIRRFSKIKHDIHVAVFICKLGYDGYYAPRLPTKYVSGTFHPEIVLCNPQSVLKVYNVKPVLDPPRTYLKLGVNNNIRADIQRTNYSAKNI